MYEDYQIMFANINKEKIYKLQSTRKDVHFDSSSLPCLVYALFLPIQHRLSEIRVRFHSDTKPFRVEYRYVCNGLVSEWNRTSIPQVCAVCG